MNFVIVVLLWVMLQAVLSSDVEPGFLQEEALYNIN